MIVPFSAGGPADAIARTVAPTLARSLKQQVVIENAGGAGGTIGTARVARARADGYTLLFNHTGHATSFLFYRNLSFHPAKDFEPVGLVVNVPMALVAKNSLPPANLRQFLTYLQAHKSAMNYGNAGLGSASHLCGLLFMSRVRADVTTVSYKGTAPALTDLLAGEFDFMCDHANNVAPYVKAGKIKAYGSATRARLTALPGVPTLAEAGLPDFEMSVWYALYAPKGTPKPVIAKLSAAVRALLTDAGAKAQLAQLGAQPYPIDRAHPEALRAHLAAEIARWTPIIKNAGVYAD